MPCGLHPIPRASHCDSDVSAQVRPVDARPAGIEQGQGLPCRMPEVVALAHADDRLVRRPPPKTFGGETVRAAVMRDLEHLHLPQRAGGEHLLLHVALGIAREDHVERTPAEAEDHARIVSGQVPGRLGRRPQHLDRSATQPPPITDHEGTHRAVRALPRSAARHRVPGRRLPGSAGSRHPGHADPVDLDHARQTPCPRGVIPVRVRQHQHVDTPNPVACERSAQCKIIGAGVHQHGPPTVAHEDRVALSHVEHGDRALPCRRGAERDRDRARCGDTQKAHPHPRRARQRPPRPQNRGGQHGDAREQPSAVQCHRRARKLRQAARDPGGHAENRCRRLRTEAPGHRQKVPGNRSRQPDEHRHRNEGAGDEVRYRRK